MNSPRCEKDAVIFRSHLRHFTRWKASGAGTLTTQWQKSPALSCIFRMLSALNSNSYRVHASTVPIAGPLLLRVPRLNPVRMTFDVPYRRLLKMTLVSQIAGAPIEVYANEGHLMQWKCPELVARDAKWFFDSHQAPSTKHQAPGTRHQAPGTRCPRCLDCAAGYDDCGFDLMLS